MWLKVGFHYPSSRPVNSGSGNRPLAMYNNPLVSENAIYSAEAVSIKYVQYTHTHWNQLNMRKLNIPHATFSQKQIKPISDYLLKVMQEICATWKQFQINEKFEICYGLEEACKFYTELYIKHWMLLTCTLFTIFLLLSINFITVFNPALGCNVQ